MYVLCAVCAKTSHVGAVIRDRASNVLRKSAEGPVRLREHNRSVSAESVHCIELTTTGYHRFGPIAQCVVHALNGLACRARVTPATVAHLPRTASSARRSRRRRSTCVAAPGLLAYTEVTKIIICF